jgi:hypothetical protein
MAFFGGGEGDADESQGWIDMSKKPRDWNRGMLCFQFEGVCVNQAAAAVTFFSLISSSARSQSSSS